MAIVKTNRPIISPTPTAVGGVLVHEETQEIIQETQPLVVSDNVSSIVHSPRLEIAQSLQYVEGSNWSVDYYSQILTHDSEALGLQNSTSGVTQQYTLIRSLELKLQGSMNAVQDDVTKEMSYSGEAIIYAGVIPNAGDCFVANMENGSPYLFKVIKNEKKQVFKETVYNITFAVQADQEAILAVLNEKVARVNHFVKDHLAFGKNPIITNNQHQSSMNAQKLWRQMLNDYMNTFFSEKRQTLIVPGLDGIYDPYVVKFMTEQFDTHMHPNIEKLRTLNIQQLQQRHSEGLYSAVTKKDIGLLNSGFTLTALYNTSGFARNPRLATAYHLDVSWVTAAVDHKRRVDQYQYNDNSTFESMGLTIAQSLWQSQYTPYTTDLGIYPVSQVPTYVLSQHFYNADRSKMSAFEKLTYDYIARVNSDVSSMNFLVSTANEFRHRWSDLDTFYLMPIFIVIVRDVAYNPSAYSNLVNLSTVLNQAKSFADDSLGPLIADSVLQSWSNLDGINVYDYFNQILSDNLSF